MYCKTSVAQKSFVFTILSVFISNVIAADFKFSERIVGGLPISIDQAAYLVQLRQRNGDVTCGGSLVSPRHVVTAGHCFNQHYFGLMSVVGGVSTLNGVGVERSIEDLVIHPEYNAVDMYSDVAIALLDRPMIGTNIRSIELCKQPLNPGDLVQVSGWGREGKEQKMSHNLKTVSVPVTSRETCRKEFTRFVEKNMFCASGLEAKGICMGDSGGPAVYNGQLCGISAFVFKCGVVGHASVFTDVYALRSYITNTIELLN